MTSDRAQLQRPQARPPNPGQLVGRGAVEIANAQSMTIANIPMGVESAFPRLADDGDGPPLSTRGADYASGFRTDENGVPIALERAQINWDSPLRRAGLITWGVDLRRPEREVLRDVERVTGMPEGILNAISLRESDLRSDRQYDQRGPTSLSSAQGPHQFTEDTWNTWFGSLGPMYGIVTEGLTREERLEHRYDIRVSGAMTAESLRYYQDDILRRAPGAPPSAGDLYLAHHGGPEGVALVAAVRSGNGASVAWSHYPNGRKNDYAAVRNHPYDFFDGVRRNMLDADGRIPAGISPAQFARMHNLRARDSAEYRLWMTGNMRGSPHVRRYDGSNLSGLSLEPVVIGPRANGNANAARVIRTGVVEVPD